MNDIQILMGMLVGGFSIMFALMMVMWSSFNKRMDRLDDKIDKLEARASSLETRMAVFESKLTDVGTNVTHLMWQHQMPRDAQEQ